MEAKEFFELEELDKDLSCIKQGIELVEDYGKLIKKVKDLRKKGK